MSHKNLDFLNNIIAKSLKLGATEAEAICYESKGCSLTYRLGKVEENEAYNNEALGIRVFIGKKQAGLSSSGKSEEIAEKLLNKAIAMAKFVPEDEFCGLADKNEILKEKPQNLDLYDDFEPSIKDLTNKTQEAETLALENPKIINSEGASAGFSKTGVYIASSNGFASSYYKSGSFLNLSVIASDGSHNEIDYDSSSAVFFNDLECPSKIAQNASLRAIKMLGSQKIKTQMMPVVFDKRNYQII